MGEESLRAPHYCDLQFGPSKARKRHQFERIKRKGMFVKKWKEIREPGQLFWKNGLQIVERAKGKR